MKELTLNESKQVNGGQPGNPGDDYLLQKFVYHTALGAANVALLTYDAISDWW